MCAGYKLYKLYKLLFFCLGVEPQEEWRRDIDVCSRRVFNIKHGNCFFCSLQACFVLNSLSSAEASWCWGEAGEKEKESARETMGRGKREGRLPHAFYFFDYCYFQNTQREPLRRRECWIWSTWWCKSVLDRCLGEIYSNNWLTHLLRGRHFE